jgi:hypothetical protein
VTLPAPSSADFFSEKGLVVPPSTSAPGGSLNERSEEVSGSLADAHAQAVAVTSVPAAELQGQGMQAQCAFLFSHLTKELNTVSYICLDGEPSSNIILCPVTTTCTPKESLENRIESCIGIVAPQG